MPREINSDIRLMEDTHLEWEADHSGVIHLRKPAGETQFLEGYGTENFGVPSYVAKKVITPGKVLLTSGLAAAGVLGVKYKDKIVTGAQVLSTFALLFRESLRK
ncbi:MAG: hypothetical protein V4598_06025 [Bdellovibrionota bacterium]